MYIRKALSLVVVACLALNFVYGDDEVDGQDGDRDTSGGFVDAADSTVRGENMGGLR